MTIRPALLRVEQYANSKCCCLKRRNTWFYTLNKHKIALNKDNDKKRVQADGITTLARGYLA